MGKIWKNNPNVPNHQPDIQCGTLKLDPNTNLNLGIVDACKNNWHVVQNDRIHFRVFHPFMSHEQNKTWYQLL